MKSTKGTKTQMKKTAMDIARERAQEVGGQLNKVVEKVLKGGMLVKDAMGLNDTVVEGIYAQAYRLYNTGKYIEASHLFRMLVTMNPMESKYTLGLAACFHMLKEYRNAVQAYTICSLIDPENPVPHYHASDCYIQMKDPLSAIVALEMTIKRAGDKKEYAAIKDRAKMTLEGVKKEFKENPPPPPSEEEEK